MVKLELLCRKIYDINQKGYFQCKIIIRYEDLPHARILYSILTILGIAHTIFPRTLLTENNFESPIDCEILVYILESDKIQNYIHCILSICSQTELQTTEFKTSDICLDKSTKS